MSKSTTKLLSVSLQYEILKLHEEGFSGNEIGKKLNISPRTAHKYIKIGQIVTKPKNDNVGRKKKLERKHLLRIKRALEKNPFSSLSDLIENCNLGCSKTTLSSFLHDNNIRRRKLMKKPLLTDNILEKRILFTKKYGLWKKRWKKVDFSDEKKFNLDGPDGYKYYWSDITKNEKLIFSKRPNSKKSLMFWGSFSYKGKIKLEILEGKINSEKYMDFIQDSFLP